MRGWIVAILVVYQVCQPGSAIAGSVLVRADKIVDGTGELLSGNEILIDDGIIVSVGDDLDDEGVETINLDSLVLVPGLIDVHVHMTYGLAGPSKGDAWNELFSTPAHDRLVASIDNARKSLQLGITSARDLFAFDGVALQLRALIESGVVVGPRLYLSGEGIHPMTLGDTTGDAAADVAARFSDIALQRAAAGYEWVKIFATSGTADDLSAEQVYFFPEIEAATDIAHANGLRVAVHSYGPSAVADSLRAGVDSIEHATGLDDDLIKSWAKTDVTYVPTIDHNRYYAEHRHEYGYDEAVAADLLRFVQLNVDTLRRVHGAGIRIAMGSDAVMSGFGQNTRELEWFVKAGMTPAEALRAATVNGALLLGEEDYLGRLSAGYAADIVAVDGDPLTDISALTRGVRWVMKDGEVVYSRSEDRGRPVGEP